MGDLAAGTHALGNVAEAWEVVRSVVAGRVPYERAPEGSRHVSDCLQDVFASMVEQREGARRRNRSSPKS